MHWKARRPGSDPEQQVLDAMSEETLTGKILGMREPYRTPCRLMLLEGRTAAEAAASAAGPKRRWRRRSTGQRKC